MNCPIGLICEYFECRRDVCADYAKPIPLPYKFCDVYDRNYPKGTLISFLPECDEHLDFDEPEYVAANRDEYNERVERVRRMMAEGGWHGFSELPYKFDEELKALVVTHEHLLKGTELLSDLGENGDLLFHGTRGFCAALPINDPVVPHPDNYFSDIEADGFCRFLLLWDTDFYEDEM